MDRKDFIKMILTSTTLSFLKFDDTANIKQFEKDVKSYIKENMKMRMKGIKKGRMQCEVTIEGLENHMEYLKVRHSIFRKPGETDSELRRRSEWI